MKLACCILATLLFASSVEAQNPTHLDYSHEFDIGSGLYDYDFTLTLDDNDSSWIAGQGWGWFIFGDSSSPPSPLADFSMTSSIPAPWSGLTFSGGGHNGPTFTPVGSFWVPSSVGESFTWTGTSANAVDEPDMLYSFLTTNNTNGAVPISFAQASQVPEPASSTLLVGLLMVVAGRRRRKRN